MSEPVLKRIMVMNVLVQGGAAVVVAVVATLLAGWLAGLSGLLGGGAVLLAQLLLNWRVLSASAGDPKDFMARFYSGEALKLIVAGLGLAVVILILAQPVFALVGFAAGVLAQLIVPFIIKEEA